MTSWEGLEHCNCYFIHLSQNALTDNSSKIFGFLKIFPISVPADTVQLYQKFCFASVTSSFQNKVATDHLNYQPCSFSKFLSAWCVSETELQFQAFLNLTFSLLTALSPTPAAWKFRGLPVSPAALTFLLLPQSIFLCSPSEA